MALITIPAQTRAVSAEGYCETFTPWELYGFFTASEIIAASMLGGAVKAQLTLLASNRDKPININDDNFLSALELLLTSGVLTEARTDELKKGVRL